MAARSDTPEMFDAFKMTSEERKRKAAEAAAKAASEPGAPEGKPEPEKKLEPVKNAEPAKSSEPSQRAEIGPTRNKIVQKPALPSRPAPAPRADRPWTPGSKAQDATFYLPLGQRCRIVLAMSYPVAIIAGMILIGALVLAFVLGDLTGRPATNGMAKGYAPGKTGAPAATGVYRVAAAWENNSEAGRKALDKIKKALQTKGYTDMEVAPTSDSKQVVLLVGRCEGADAGDKAEDLKNRLLAETIDNRQPFWMAKVFHTQ